ncbi:hypothetical protein TSUD_301070 [Trifolium subterraneum]|uniref:Micro-fibrillar-associated protein 1 C-terminal domain-containing protein n=1 Tax=Trifolium subterraneum TaxID=3900 RepID=A0A2Z6PJ79_TRISU|nr:hypothetical protein TSUD_301070 [Trifolium subterraneum]
MNKTMLLLGRRMIGGSADWLRVVWLTKQEELQLEEQYDEDAMAERRRLLKAKLLQREQEELLPRNEDDEEEEESEYETDFDEEYTGPTGVAMMKPVFVFKFERNTIVAHEEEALEEQRKRILEERRRIETKQIVFEAIRKDQKNIELEDNNADIDIDDQINEAEEY